MDSKDFHQITISELVRRAGVSRQSFYRNYTSKEDIIIEIEDALLKTFQDSLSDPKYRGDFHLWLLDLFEFLRKNQHVITVLQKAGLLDILFSKAPFLVEDLVQYHSRPFHYHIIGSLGAIKSIALEWFLTGMQESTEEMADTCMMYSPLQDIV